MHAGGAGSRCAAACLPATSMSWRTRWQRAE
jgi:hypothetical protein